MSGEAKWAATGRVWPHRCCALSASYWAARRERTGHQVRKVRNIPIRCPPCILPPRLLWSEKSRSPRRSIDMARSHTRTAPRTKGALSLRSLHRASLGAVGTPLAAAFRDRLRNSPIDPARRNISGRYLCNGGFVNQINGALGRVRGSALDFRSFLVLDELGDRGLGEFPAARQIGVKNVLTAIDRMSRDRRNHRRAGAG